MRYLTALALLLLAGCATLPSPTVDTTPELQRARRMALQHWSLTGRVGVAAAGEGFSAALDWQQRGADSDIGLRGPLGTAALRVMITGEHLVVADGRGGVLEGAGADALLTERLGTRLPVDEMRYWLLGLPAPEQAADAHWGPQGDLLALDQAGWQIRYEAYGGQQDLRLPSRLELTAGDVRVRLVVRQWQLTP